MRPLKILFLFATIVLGMALGFWHCTGNGQNKADAFFLNLNDTVSYVGINQCRACHEDKYNSFIRTGMGNSFGPATKERSKGAFPSKPVYDVKTDLYYYMWWDKEAMMVTEFRLRGKDTVHKRTEQISHIIGSGHHTNSHFWSDNGHLFQAPLTYYTQTGRWDLPPGFEVTNTRFSRKIDIECMACHNAMPEVEKGSVNKFTKIPAGIDCERCHGPGELHVQTKTKGILVNTKTEADRTIVNPAKLPWKLQVDICQRCHLQGNNVLKSGKNFSDFRPGMALSDVFDVYMPSDNGSTFFMAGHAERLQQSACFIQSNKKGLEQYNAKLNFTCITCHDPHVSVKETGVEKFNNACKNCHQEKGVSKLKKCSENATKISKQKNNCVHCHMPPNRTGDIPHVTVHDHFIRKDYAQQKASGKSGLLYAVNEQKPDKSEEIKAYITWFEKFDPNKIYLEEANNLIQKNKPASDILVQFLYANSDWKGIVSEAENMDSKNADAWTCYRIGKALDKDQQLGISLTWYEQATLKMPGNTDFAVEYGNALVRSKRYRDAELVLRNTRLAVQKNDLVLVNLGAALYGQGKGKFAEAAKCLHEAIQLAPDNENAHLYLAELYIATGSYDKASKELQEALRISPSNQQAASIQKQLQSQHGSF